MQVPAASSRRRTTGGGSPYQVFQNERLKTFKATASAADLTSAGTLTKEALERARKRCTEDWKAMPLEAKQPYKDLYNARLTQRRLEASQAATREAAAEQVANVALHPASHWGIGTQQSPVHPELFAAAIEGSGKLPSPGEVFNALEFAILELEPGDLLGATVQLEPCNLLGRNICQQHPRYQDIAKLHQVLKTFCDVLGKEAAGTGDILCLFEGTEPRPPTLDVCTRVCALLSHVSYSPKFQDWTMCDAADGSHLSAVELVFPVEVKLGAVALHHLPGVADGQVLHHKTSDDLSAYLDGIARRWRLRVCKYELLSPWRMKVVGVDEAIDLATSTSTRARSRAGLPQDLVEALALNDLGDPLCNNNMQAASAPRPRRSRQPTPRSGRQSALETAAGAPEDGGDHELFGGPGDDDEDEQPEAFEPPAPLENPPSFDGELLGLGEGLLIPEIDRSELMDGQAVAEPGRDPTSSPRAGGPADVDAWPDVVGMGAAHGAEIAAAVAELGGFVDLASELSGLIDEDDRREQAVAGEQHPPQPLQQDQPGPHGAASSSSSAALAPAAAAAALPPTPMEAPASEEVASSAGAAQPAAPVQSPGDPIVDGPPGWTMTPGGYVFCDAARLRGRITSWRHNVSVRCTLHGCSKAKRRTAVTDGQLAQWLAAGVVASAAAPETPADQLKKAHIQSFVL